MTDSLGWEQVNFATWTPSESRRRITGRRWLLAISVPGVSVFLTHAVITQRGIPGLPSICIGCLGLLGVGAVLWGTARRKRGAAQDADQSRCDDGRARLRCIGRPSHIMRYGVLHGHFFEPLRFRAWFAVPLPAAQRAVVAVLTLALGALCFAWSAQAVAPPMLFGIWTSFSVAWLSSMGLVALLWPAYFRLSPGLLEVIRYSPVRQTPVQHRLIDLRSARILADLTRGLLVVETRSSKDVWRLHLTKTSSGLAHAVFLAAVSPHAHPPPASQTL